MAQLVEQRTCNAQVSGSNPDVGSRFDNGYGPLEKSSGPFLTINLQQLEF